MLICQLSPCPDVILLQMTTHEWLKKAIDKLEAANIQTSRIDSLVLLEDATSKDRAWLLAHDEYELTTEEIVKLNNQIERRCKHEPLAYIRGKSEFYGREFIINEHTLEPRPETETMIELLQTIDLNNIHTIIDIGTGSGAIAITAKLMFPELEVFGTDIDEKCIQTAKANAKKHNASIDFRQGNLLEPFSSEFANNWLIVANLPYVPDSHTINQAAMFEPKHAIFGGSDGLDIYRKMFEQIDGLGNKPTYILTESLPFQHQELATIAELSGYSQHGSDDFIQLFKLG